MTAHELRTLLSPLPDDACVVIPPPWLTAYSPEIVLWKSIAGAWVLAGRAEDDVKDEWCRACNRSLREEASCEEVA